MKLLKSDLTSAVQKGILDADQAAALWSHIESRRPEQARFQALHVLYYFGGVLLLASMPWFLTKAWDDGLSVMAISGLFGLLVLVAGHSLWSQQHLKIPGGLLITAAVGLTPVLIYGFQKATGLWHADMPGDYQDYHRWIKGGWFFMEAGTILAATLALRFYRFPFITFPLGLSLWYMSMDVAPLLYGANQLTPDQRNTVSCAFGLVVLVVSFFVDRKFRKLDFAFWTYLYGMVAFWSGLSMMNTESELNKFAYAMLNIGFIVLSVYLRRKVFIVFGTVGVLGYIAHLAWRVFQDSYAFPIVLALLGIAIVFLGVKIQRNKEQFESFVVGLIPPNLMKWRPEERL